MHALHKSALSVSVIALSIAGPLFAQYPNCGEATVLGLELTGELVAPTDVVSQIARDLAIIRDAYPMAANITVSPSWTPGVLLVGLTDGAWAQYLAGTFTALDALNEEYGLTIAGQIPFIMVLILASQDCSNPTVMVDAYWARPEVMFVEPNNYPHDVDDITCTALGWYTFKHGWGDCSFGCTQAHYWQFRVIDNAAILVNEYGDTTSGVEDSDRTAGFELRQNHPNPFNPATSVSFALGEASFVSIDIYDLAGRLVCALFAGDMAAGDHEISWRGQDSRGSAVASGVYVCRLKADTSVASMKMLLAD